MNRHSKLAAILMAVLFACGSAALAGNGKPDKPGKHDQRDERGRGGEGWRFDDDSRRIIFDYYGAQAHQGKCPPGLAKKRNGCLPPGQAKKWRVGRPLPRDLIFHDLPHDILLRLPPPPLQHRYVQVAGDILMIAVGTGMVLDAVEDILR